MTTEQFDEDIGAIAALAEPTRRDLYAYIAEQPEPVSRDQGQRQRSTFLATPSSSTSTSSSTRDC